MWDRYCCRLRAFIRGRVADESEADDILQEVLIRIHRTLCCREWNKPESWIYQVTRNLIIDHYRSRRETVELTESMLAREEDPVKDDPVSRLSFSLRETVEAMPEPYREALILVEYEGLSQKALPGGWEYRPREPSHAFSEPGKSCATCSCPVATSSWTVGEESSTTTSAAPRAARASLDNLRLFPRPSVYQDEEAAMFQDFPMPMHLPVLARVDHDKRCHEDVRPLNFRKLRLCCEPCCCC